MHIGICRFQPFQSRQRATLYEDYIVGLRFAYDPEVIAALKRILAKYKDEVRDEARRIYVAGTWLRDYKVWYVEGAVWPKVKEELWLVYPDIEYTIMPPPLYAQAA